MFFFYLKSFYDIINLVILLNSLNVLERMDDMQKYAFYTCQLGLLKIGYSDEGIFLIQTVKEIDTDNQSSDLSDLAFTQLQEFFQGKRQTFDLPLQIQGTPFQEKVWRALCHIPYGETQSYGQIAAAIGNPKASRAVGLANNKNPLQFVVPCHRVVGANGSLVGYAGGLDMKKHLLEMEAEAKK